MSKYNALTDIQKNELQKFIKTSKNTTEIRRAQAILLIDSGESEEKIQLFVGFVKRTALNWKKIFRQKGIEVLKIVENNGARSVLNKTERKEIIDLITTKTPKDFNFTSDFWTIDILATFIHQKYGIKYKSKNPFYLIYKQANFTWHLPGKKYEKNNSEKIIEWKKQNKEEIENALKNPNIVVLTEDEMILKSCTILQRVWLKKGETPKIENSNKRENRSFYGFLNIKNGKQHAFCTEKQNMEITAEILEKIREIYPEKEILLIWDNAPWHHGIKVKEFIIKDEKIKIINFPAYSPELNPQEHVWKSARMNVTNNKSIKKINIMANEVLDYLNNTEFKYKFFN